MRKNQNGFSLIELIITMAIGLTLVAGVMKIFGGTIKSSSDFLAMAKLDQDLQSILELMAKEIRRSGYDPGFTPGKATEFHLKRVSANCLIYSYDNDGDGNEESNERFAFKHYGNEIQFGEQANESTCEATWTKINDSEVVLIENLNFEMDTKCINLTNGSNCTAGASDYTPLNSGDQYIEKYQVTISITGNFKGGSEDNQKTVRAVVRSNNDVIKNA